MIKSIEENSSQSLQQILTDIGSFDNLYDDSRTIDTTKHFLVVIDGLTLSKDLDDLNSYIKNDPGVLYKIYRDYNFIRIDINKLMLYQQEALDDDDKDSKIIAWFFQLLPTEHYALNRLSTFVFFNKKKMLGQFQPRNYQEFIYVLEDYDSKE